jgi:hypothetical protein
MIQSYFLYVKFICFRVFARKRKSVTAMGRDTQKIAISTVDTQYDTYSTRSTVIVTDEFMRMPP